MKISATLLAVIAALVTVSGHGYGGVRGGSVSPASVPAVPCPRNYLFSCQPSLAPVPCAAPAVSYGGSHAASHGSVGAYSENVPTIINAPPYHYQRLPSNFLQVPDYYINY